MKKELVMEKLEMTDTFAVWLRKINDALIAIEENDENINEEITSIKNDITIIKNEISEQPSNKDVLALIIALS